MLSLSHLPPLSLSLSLYLPATFSETIERLYRFLARRTNAAIPVCPSGSGVGVPRARCLRRPLAFAFPRAFRCSHVLRL